MEGPADADKCPVHHPAPAAARGSSPAAEGPSQCPVQHSASSWFGLGSWFGGSAAAQTPAAAEQAPNAQQEQPRINPLTNEFHYSQQRQPGQQRPLGVHRQRSSIPKGDYTPHHQPQDSEYWVYPSEQQYYNAMKKKGYNPEERDMGIILAIHNLVNEQGWAKIKEWEREKGCENPKLLRFMGRPKDISPKARLRSLMGYTLPFDRHDWYVDRNGKEVRYVIDFYNGAPQSLPTPNGSVQAPVSIFLDVRPALDSVEALVDRLKMSGKEFLGLKSSNSNPTSTASTNAGGSSSSSQN